VKSKIKEFEDYLKKNTKLSDNTISCYLMDINQFSNYLINNGFKSFSDITNSILLAFCASLQSKGTSQATILRKISSIKKFYGYLNIRHNLGIDINSFVDLPKHKKSLPKFVNSSEINKLLDTLDTTTTKGIRDRAMLELLYATGIKVSELVELKLFDLSMDKLEITCNARDGFNTLPFSKQTKEVLREYLNKSRPKLTAAKTNDHLFLNMKGNIMTRQGFWKIIKEQVVKAGIDKDICPNTLRNSFAVHLINNGADVMDIKDMMGHSDISTTNAYFEAAKSEKLRRAITKNHPRTKEK